MNITEQTTAKDILFELAQQFGYIIIEKSKTLSPENIIQCVINVTGVSLDEMQGVKKTRRIATARWLVIHFMKREFPVFSKSQIGRYINRPSSSVLNAIRLMDNLIDKGFEMQKKRVDWEISRIE